MAGQKTRVYVSKTGSLETSRQEEEKTSRSGVGADEGDDNIQVKPTPTQNAIDNDSKDTETQKIPFQRPLIKKKSWRKQGAGQCNDGKQLPWKEDEVEMGAGVNHKLSAIES